MLTVYGRTNSVNVQKVLWCLAELALQHTRIDAGLEHGKNTEPWYLALNPNGKVPLLVDGTFTLWESNTIVRYLAARYGGGRLWAEDPAERSLAERWMDWELATLQPNFMALFWGFFRTPERERDAAAIRGATRRCAADFALLDAHLARQPFLGGERFGMGDIPVGTALHRYFEMGAGVEEPPHVRGWYERLAERPAYREHVMRPFEELRGRLAF